MTKAKDEILEAFGKKRKQGQTPYGFASKDGLLVENVEEKDIISKMQVWREQEKLSYDAIAGRLNEMLIESRKNTRWFGSVVNEILTRQEILEVFPK